MRMLTFRWEVHGLWDFKIYKPAIVSIALGTNDLSDGEQTAPRLPFDSAEFVSRYIKFVQQVKSKYSGRANCAAQQSNVNGDRRTKLQNCLTAVKQHVDNLYSADKPVATFFFEPMQAQGCTGHPNVADHGVMADEVTPFFKQLLE